MGIVFFLYVSVDESLIRMGSNKYLYHNYFRWFFYYKSILHKMCCMFYYCYVCGPGIRQILHLFRNVNLKRNQH